MAASEYLSLNESRNPPKAETLPVSLAIAPSRTSRIEANASIAAASIKLSAAYRKAA